MKTSGKLESRTDDRLMRMPSHHRIAVMCLLDCLKHTSIEALAAEVDRIAEGNSIDADILRKALI